MAMAVADGASAEPGPETLRHLEYCRALPKAELHAHLNGCVRAATLLELSAGQLVLPELLKLTQQGASRAASPQPRYRQTEPPSSTEP